jgi:chemotaxis methyl-accepting protein methylase
MEIKINDIIEHLRVCYGTDISSFDDSFIEKTIEIRKSTYGSLSLTDYYFLLKMNSEEVQSLINAFFISYSEFFRNTLTFAYLEQFVLPHLFAEKKRMREPELRIWSAACASGQEAYSLAILCHEMNESSSEKLDIRIFATDDCQTELEKASEGNFPASSLNKVTLRRIQSYFVQKEENYVISQDLKQYVDFSQFDLLSAEKACPTPSIFGNFDLVLCCNILFYYKPIYRKRILDKVGNTLASGGYLITGETEREILCKNSYHEVFENSAIYKKVDKS